MKRSFTVKIDEELFKEIKIDAIKANQKLPEWAEEAFKSKLAAPKPPKQKK